MKIFLFFILTQLIKGQNVENSNNSPIHVLGSIEKAKTSSKYNSDFDPSWVKDLKLVLPCKGIMVPKRASRLPNAPRDYRNGVHRGVDFFANWGTNIRAVAEGMVVRADHNYKEYPADFRIKMLKSSGKVGHTPSDIFNSVLLGKSVFLDHGFDLIPGFRTISIYAHLSHIEKDVAPGAVIKKGEILGKSGNTGMRESTIGSKSGSHLHWEMILQKDEKEIYLGKGMSNPELYNMLYRIFNSNKGHK